MNIHHGITKTVMVKEHVDKYRRHNLCRLYRDGFFYSSKKGGYSRSQYADVVYVHGGAIKSL
jgi:hypothetical protein